MNPQTTWELVAWMPRGYLATILIETAVLLALLSPVHGWKRRVTAGVWLTACTYPIVVVAIPTVMGMEPRWAYLAVAEVFAPVAECALFTLAFHTPTTERRVRFRDWTGVTVANLASFLTGEICAHTGWPKWLATGL